MRRIVFYSWQSDLPNPVNRGFIQQALEKAIKTIETNDTVVLDRDTSGIPGSPDIASTIYAKISSADVFIADVSIISKAEGCRPTPNPNVLIELGYALKALGQERIILVFNGEYGKIEDLPFDLRTKRIMIYNALEKMKELGDKRTELEKKLKTGIITALEHVSVSEEGVPAIPAINAIENGQLNRVLILRRNLDSIFHRLISFEPKKHSDGGTVDELREAIDNTQEALAEFSKISEIVSVMNDKECVDEIYKWFGKILEKYDHPKGFSGRSSNADQDFFKFIGHELFVTFVAFLLREQRFDIITNILSEPIFLNYFIHANGPTNVDWSYASDYLPSLADESTKTRRKSVHADILNSRHSDGGGLSMLMPFEDFISADAFLYLIKKVEKVSNPEFVKGWYPFSLVYLRETPYFIKKATGINMANQLVKVFKLSSVDELRAKFKEADADLNRFADNPFWRRPIYEKDIDKIATH
ncbi:MAG: hypothetical protein WC120_00545 [Parcubacteria group bacterium]